MLNRCEFIGNLGDDPTVRQTQSGDQVVNFTIACGEKWKDKSGQLQERTEWIRIVVFGNLAKVCADYLHKGSKIFVTGKYKTDKWQDQSGNDRYSTSIVAREVEFLSPRQEQGQQQAPTKSNNYEPPNTGNSVPF